MNLSRRNLFAVAGRILAGGVAASTGPGRTTAVVADVDVDADVVLGLARSGLGLRLAVQAGSGPIEVLVTARGPKGGGR